MWESGPGVGILYESQWPLLQQSFPSEDLLGEKCSDQAALAVIAKDPKRHLQLEQVAGLADHWLHGHLTGKGHWKNPGPNWFYDYRGWNLTFAGAGSSLGSPITAKELAKTNRYVWLKWEFEGQPYQGQTSSKTSQETASIRITWGAFRGRKSPCNRVTEPESLGLRYRNLHSSPTDYSHTCHIWGNSDQAFWGQMAADGKNNRLLQVEPSGTTSNHLLAFGYFPLKIPPSPGPHGEKRR